jgi:hypothetical protein
MNDWKTKARGLIATGCQHLHRRNKSFRVPGWVCELVTAVGFDDEVKAMKIMNSID